MTNAVLYIFTGKYVATFADLLMLSNSSTRSRDEALKLEALLIDVTQK